MKGPPLRGYERRYGRDRPPAILLVPALLAACLALLPLAYLLVRASENGLGAAAEILGRERTLRLAVRSLVLTATVTCCCLIVGVGFAFLTIRTNLPGRRVWRVLLALPLAVPSYVAAYIWLSASPAIAGFGGAVLVLTTVSYPYVYIPVAASLRRADPALEEVSRSLGRGSLGTLLAVTVRQVRPAAAAGGLLVALYVLSDFGAVSILRYDVFTRVIYTSYKASFDRVPAAVLSVLLVAITIAITVGEARSRGRAGRARLGSGAARRPQLVRLRGWTPVAVAATGLTVAASLGVPLVGLGYWLVRARAAAVDPGRLLDATVNTFGVSFFGMLATVALAIPVGVLAARSRGSGIGMIEHATYAGHALPGLVVALAMVVLGARYLPWIYQEAPLLVLAYAVLFLPAAVGAVRASVGQSPRRLEEVARSLGNSPLRVLARITLPLATPGIAAGAALTMLACMKELPATLLLRPTGFDTLATRLWSETGVGAYGEAAPYAAALVLLAAIPTIVLGQLRDRRQHATYRPTEAVR